MKRKKYEMKFMGQEGLCAKKEAFHFAWSMFIGRLEGR